MVREKVRERGEIQFRRNGVRREKRLDLGREVQRAVRGMHVVERLHAKAIAPEQELTSAGIPDRECEHASKMLGRLLAVQLAQAQHGLGVTACPIPISLPLQLHTKRRMIVDLAIVYDAQRPIAAEHRLPPAVDVDDAQALMAEADALIEKDPVVVRTTVYQDATHP